MSCSWYLLRPNTNIASGLLALPLLVGLIAHPELSSWMFTLIVLVLFLLVAAFKVVTGLCCQFRYVPVLASGQLRDGTARSFLRGEALQTIVIG